MLITITVGVYVSGFMRKEVSNLERDLIQEIRVIHNFRARGSKSQSSPVFNSSSRDPAGHDGFMVSKFLLPDPFSNGS